LMAEDMQSGRPGGAVLVGRVGHAAKSVVKTQLLRRDRVAEADYQARLEVCRHCPGAHATFKSDGSLHTCGPMVESLKEQGRKTCGCVLSKKARDAKETCPFGYWPTLERRPMLASLPLASGRRYREGGPPGRGVYQQTAAVGSSAGLAAVQSAVLLGAAVHFLAVTFEHGVALFFLVELLSALSALGIGILLSLFADNEFQAIQFIPAVITPQVVLGGTFVPVDRLDWYLEYPARAMPVTYLVEGMEYVVIGRGEAADLWTAVAVLAGFTVLTVGAAGIAIRRRTG